MTSDGIDLAASRAILIGTGVYDDKGLPPIPQANHSINRLSRVLTDPALCGWPADSVGLLPDQLERRDALELIQQYSQEATGCLLFYFVGHGVPDRDGRLFLALRRTAQDHPHVCGLAYEHVRRAVSDSRATLKIIILDCCWSSDVSPPRATSGGNPLSVKGTVVLTASVTMAKAAPGDGAENSCTAFTGALLKHVVEGVPDAGEYLTIGALYAQVKQSLDRSGLPEPDLKGQDLAHTFCFSRNVAHRPFLPARKRGTVATPPVERELESVRLLDAVRSGTEAVVVVTGLAGVGKSTLAHRVLGAESAIADEFGSRLQWRELTPGAPWNADTLVDTLAAAAGRPAPMHAGGSVLDRLDLVLTLLADMAVTVVIDSAEHLLLPGTNRFSMELDEVFELLTTRRDKHRVRVVLIMRQLPSSSNDFIWPHQVEHVPIKGLGLTDFARYLRHLDGLRRHDVKRRSDGELAACWRTLNGNPRLAELMFTHLDGDLTNSFDEQVARLVGMRFSDVVRQIRTDAHAQVNAVRHVLRAVAALQMPAGPALVCALLRDGSDAKAVVTILRNLAARRLVNEVDVEAEQPTGRRYYVPTSEIDWVLGDLSEQDREDLLVQAALHLSNYRVAKSDIRGPQDLTVHFTQLDVTLRAHAYRLAFKLVESISEVVEPWGLGGLLLPAREAVRDHLDEHGTPVNFLALGDIYVEQRRRPEAMDAYEKALSGIRSTSKPELRRRILLSIGSLHWLYNEVDQAEHRYKDALSMAQEFDDLDDQAAAWDSLARCSRHRGDYSQAFRRGALALSLGQQSARAPEVVGVALRLSRWYAEVGERDSAARLLDVAKREALEYRSAPLMADYFDGYADLLLADDDPAAVPTARTAVERALQSYHPAVLVHARTTLAYCYLKRGDARQALREIERATPYRFEGRALEVLALHGLASLGAGHFAKADDRFRKLHDEARRLLRDEGDFVSRYMLGFAICAIDGHRGRSLSSAREEFTRAGRQPTRLTPGLLGRIASMLRILQEYRQSRELADVISRLVEAGAQPGGA
jgi:tetratricopeptide (TPR) repeat protein